MTFFEWLIYRFTPEGYEVRPKVSSLSATARLGCDAQAGHDAPGDVAERFRTSIPFHDIEVSDA